MIEVREFIHHIEARIDFQSFDNCLCRNSNELSVKNFKLLPEGGKAFIPDFAYSNIDQLLAFSKERDLELSGINTCHCKQR